MKTITAREHELILDVRNEGLTSLPPGIFEKDLLITEVLRTVVAVDSNGIGLAFCRGTCLSKAHGLAAGDLVLVPQGAIPITTSGKIRRSSCVEIYQRDGFDRLDASARSV